MANESDKYIIKLKGLKTPDTLIASKLGLTVEELNTRWNAILGAAESMEENGYGQLTETFNTFALQYQLLGQNLAQIAQFLNGAVLLTDIADAVKDCKSPEETATVIVKKFIVFHKFVPVDPKELMKNLSGG